MNYPMLSIADFLAQRRQKPLPQIIDLRESTSFHQGHLAGARSIPWRLLPEEAIFFSPKTTYLLYSNAEQEGIEASLNWLGQRHFKQVSYAAQGFEDIWKALREDPAELQLGEQPTSQWVKSIEEVLDQQLRPYLDADGGGIEIDRLEGSKLFVHFTGACKNCDASRTATLRLIQVSLSVLLNHDLKVVANRATP